MEEGILIFEEEAKAGLSDLIRNNLVTATSLLQKDTKTIDPKVLENLSIATNLSLPDLFPVKGILATTGDNLNDDFFEVEETIAAKDTPINKPFNFEHKSSDIIGHMTGSCLLDHDGNLIGEEIPDSFDVGFSAVLYRHFSDNKNKQERTDKILKALAEPTEDDKWFVSMECRFNGFNYVMFPENESVASAKLVKRTENTAFLTKHLRIYGGEGTYKGNRVLRAFSNLKFSAIGLVRHPGNPRSVISTSSAGRNSGKINTILTTLGYEKNNEEIMNDNENKELKAELAKAQKDLVEANKLVTETAKANWDKQVADLQGSVATLTKELNTEKANVNAAKSEVEVAKAALTKLEDEKKELVANLDKFKLEAEKATAARIKLDRLGKVKEAYSVTDEAKAEQLFNTISALTDEAFALHIETIKSIVKSVKVEKVEVKPADAAVAALNNATPIIEPNLTVPVVDKTGEDAKALAAEMLNWRGDVEEVDGESVAKVKNKKSKVKTSK